MHIELNHMVPIISLCIALASFGMSMYVVRRDSSQFAVEGIYQESFGNVVDGVYVKIVNIGRRPITLHKLRFKFSRSASEFLINNSIAKRIGSPLEKVDTNHPLLLESQFFEFLLDQTNFDFQSLPLEDLEKIEVVLSTGKKRTIKEIDLLVKNNARKLKQKT